MREKLIAAVLDKHPREKYIEDDEGINDWWEGVVAGICESVMMYLADNAMEKYLE